jgi:hypothetical protein
VTLWSDAIDDVIELMLFSAMQSRDLIHQIKFMSRTSLMCFEDSFYPRQQALYVCTYIHRLIHKNLGMKKTRVTVVFDCGRKVQE